MLAEMKQKNEESRKALQKNEKTEAATPPNTD